MSALMWAARKDEQEKAVNELISAGADLNLKNREVYYITYCSLAKKRPMGSAPCIGSNRGTSLASC